jgi:L-asparaginase / beta-aspartyl-peptidase
MRPSFVSRFVVSPRGPWIVLIVFICLPWGFVMARQRIESRPVRSFEQDVATTGAADTSVEEAAATRIKAVLPAQAEAWNRADIDRFMEYYWRSDDLTFSSGGKTTRGWSSTLANYKRRYPTAEKMGKVSFGQIEIVPLGATAALVLGRWNLRRDDDPVGGNFSLVFRHIDGKWRIIHDHTSRSADGE